MGSIEDYINSPDIIDEPMPLREVHAIRLMIKSETCSLSNEEKIRYTQKTTNEVIKKFGLSDLIISRGDSL
jgi:hypothetical protein